MPNSYKPENFNIMVVSDQKRFRVRYGSFFEDCGYNVYVTTDPFDCGRSYKKNKKTGVRIDLMVLDDDMFKSSAVVRDIKEWDRDAEILVLGGEKRLCDDACDTVLVDCAYDTYLSKNGNMGDVLKAASSLLRNRMTKFVTLADVVQTKQEVMADA